MKETAKQKEQLVSFGEDNTVLSVTITGAEFEEHNK